MVDTTKLYIDGKWTDPGTPRFKDALNPATEEVTARVAFAGVDDVDRAVRAARRAFDSYAQTDRATRLALLNRIANVYRRRKEEIARILTLEIGVPRDPALNIQVTFGLMHLEQAIEALAKLDFDTLQGTTLIAREPIGVCGLITPWNFPMIQMICKVAPALAVGCTVVLKPSELAPLSAAWLAEVLHEAGVPAGVFNLVHGDGETVGAALAGHADVDMISVTGSTRAGIAIAKAAADSVKRVHQELGGKSANVLLSDVDFEAAVPKGVMGCFRNSGQSCSAPTRMLVPSTRLEDVVRIASATAASVVVGDPNDAATVLGPVANRPQFDKVQRMIRQAVEEGARLVAGGPDRPHGLKQGFYVRPTIFVCRPDMTVARDEVFGPVLAIIPYKDEDEAVRLANDNPYGLGGYVQSGDLQHAHRVARRLRTGTVNINYPAFDLAVPFGGYRQSGNGREYGSYGLLEYLETKSIIGWGAD